MPIFVTENSILILGNKNKLLEEAVCKDLEISPKYFITENELDLTEKLEEVVAYYLNYHFERLLYILVKLDVPEDKLNLALASSAEPPEKIIAQLIIAREWQKIETRKIYKSPLMDSEREW